MTLSFKKWSLFNVPQTHLVLLEKQRLVHCHGSSPDGTDPGQTGPQGKKAFALEAPSRGKSFDCLRGFSGEARIAVGKA